MSGIVLISVLGVDVIVVFISYLELIVVECIDGEFAVVVALIIFKDAIVV